MSFLFLLIVASGAQVDALIAQGIELRQEGKNEEALIAFRKAHELSGSPRALAQVGLVEVALGHWFDAETDLANALVSAGDPWVEQHRDALNGALRSAGAKLGWVELVVKPTGAKIRLNGQDLGISPLGRRVRVLAGAATLELEALGYQSIVRTLQIRAESSNHEEFELKTQALTRGVEASDAARLSERTPALVPPSAPPERSALGQVPTLAWITGAVSVASLGVGVAGTVVQVGCGEGCNSSTGVVLMAVGYGLGAIMAGITAWQIVDSGDAEVGTPSPSLPKVPGAAIQ